MVMVVVVMRCCAAGGHRRVRSKGAGVGDGVGGCVRGRHEVGGRERCAGGGGEGRCCGSGTSVVHEGSVGDNLVRTRHRRVGVGDEDGGGVAGGRGGEDGFKQMLGVQLGEGVGRRLDVQEAGLCRREKRRKVEG